MKARNIDLFDEIRDLKAQKRALLLAHYYQDSEIQDLADFVGDSLELARAAKSSKAPLIVFAGVHFMAEGAKILNPDAKVLLPDLRAGCSLSDSCSPAMLAKFKERNPDHFVVSYINCSAGVKALSDVICTSSNALKIIEKVPKDRPILFAPDRNLGAFVSRQTGREMTLWPGTCIVHETFSERKIIDLMVKNPEAKLIAHPECEKWLLDIAHFVGSTSALLKYSNEDSSKAYIVATEEGILHAMKKLSPEKTFIPAPPNQNCNCSECPFMKLNTPEKILQCLKSEAPEINMDETLRMKALRPLERMLEWSQ